MKQVKGESSLEASLRYLIEEAGFDLADTTPLSPLLDRCRQIRNDFAHGDWENVQDAIQEINLVSAFGAASDLFTQIENGMPKVD